MRDLHAPLAELNRSICVPDCGAWPLLGECAASAEEGDLGLTTARIFARFAARIPGKENHLPGLWRNGG
jgi:hypothetical protein